MERLLEAKVAIKNRLQRLVPRIPDYPDRRKGLKIAVGAALGLGLVGCSDHGLNSALEAQRRMLEEAGMSGEHPVIDLRSIPGFFQNGSIAGGFLVLSGEFQGKTMTMLQFAWKTREEDKTFQISQLPLDIVQFRTVDPAAKPTVKFDIDETGLKKLFKYYDLKWSAQRTDNLNNYVAVSRLAVISLSEKDYEAFRTPQR